MFFGATALVKTIIMWLYPILIVPLFSHYEPMPEYAEKLLKFLNKEAVAAGCKEDNIQLEKSYQYDVHTNAQTMLGKIVIGEPLLRQHSVAPAEVVAVLCHELGHYKESHLMLSSVVDSFYMLIYGYFLAMFTNNPDFLRAFGVSSETYFLSFFFFTYLWAITADVILRIGLR